MRVTHNRLDIVRMANIVLCVYNFVYVWHTVEKLAVSFKVCNTHACAVSSCVHCVHGLTFTMLFFHAPPPLQSRSPKHGPSSQPSVGDQVDHLSLASLESLDAMSEADAPTAFTRGSRVRASLPVVRSTNQTKDRSLGTLCIGLLGLWQFSLLKFTLIWIRFSFLLFTTKCLSFSLKILKQAIFF